MVVEPGPFPEALDLLQGDDVGAIDDARDAFEVIAAIAAEAVLNVVVTSFTRHPPVPGRVLNPATPGWQAAASARAHRPSRTSWEVLRAQAMPITPIDHRRGSAICAAPRASPAT